MEYDGNLIESKTKFFYHAVFLLEFKVYVHWYWKLTATLQGHVTVHIKPHFSSSGIWRLLSGPNVYHFWHFEMLTHKWLMHWI